MILGDFNIVEDTLDRLPSHEDPENVREELRNLMDHLGLIDGWRRINKNEVTYTCHVCGHEVNYHLRLDRIYVRRSMMQDSDD